MSCSENQSPQSNPAVPTSASGSPQIASSESSTSARTSPEASPVTNAISHQTSTQTALEQDQATSSSSSSTNTRSWGALSSVFELLSGNQLARSSRSISGSHLEDSVGYDDVLSRHMASKDDRNHTNRLKEDLSCPICQDIMKEAFITSCGHSYCHSCITKYIDANPYCPLCRTEITRSDIHPNFQLNHVAQQLSQTYSTASFPFYAVRKDGQFQLNFAKRLARELPSSELLEIFSAAVKERQSLENIERYSRKELFEFFLSKIKEDHRRKIDELQQQIDAIDHDLKEITDYDESGESSKELIELSTSSPFHGVKRKRSPETSEADHDNKGQSSQHDTFQLAKKKRRVMDRFDDLRDLYFNSLKKERTTQNVNNFISSLYEMSRYSGFKPLDTIRYTDSNSASSIVSSMDFSRDNRYFAVGGVTKEIKVFDSNLIHPTFNMDDDEETGDQQPPFGVIHCPIQTMSSKHKISCVCWNPYVQSQLASSDYGGNVSIWDASTGLCVRTFQEHKQRAWSVDISRTNPDIMASASDDATVKIWSMNQSRSIYTFTEKSNVCSVHFGPHDHHQLMVGSADSNIRWYDTRWTRDALLTLKGHNKTVSYIKWLNNTELVSLSIDGSLKLWDLSNKECKRTYTGHTNRRNFVGLSVEGDWFSCGSEDNAVYTYHKYSAKPSLIYKFPSVIRSVDDDSLGESSTAFGSSVCWKRNSNILLAANSKGMIQALSLE